jgi:SSS family solute:Na+ symporter
VTHARAKDDTIRTAGVRYATSRGFNIGALSVVLILVALYASFW